MEISMNNFECGHVLAEAKGGQLSVENLRPICGGCNRSMGSENLEDFKRRCGFGNLVKNAVSNEKTSVSKLDTMEQIIPNNLSSDLTHRPRSIKKNTNKLESNETRSKTEIPITPPLHERRKTIVGGIKRQVWDKHVGSDLAKSKCPCCKYNLIDVNTFVCAHFKGEEEGGSLAVDNLRPICTTCDIDIDKKSINEFMKEYNII
jgi:5-methylcytosine-specific restriction endonuclease McrA